MTTLNPNKPADRGDSAGAPRSSETSRRTGMCSTGLMKSGCPSCLLVGLVLLPMELGVRGIKKLTANSGGVDDHKAKH